MTLPVSASHNSSLTGTSSLQPHAELWEPYDGRLSRTVLREREGEVPSRHSPRRHRTPGGVGRGHNPHDTHSQRSEPSHREDPPRTTPDDTDLTAPPRPAQLSSEDTDLTAPPRPTQLSGEAQRRLHAARLWIAANRPYYCKALFSCQVIATNAAARIGIDEQWRIYANSDLLESLTVEQAAADLIHVLNHALRNHAQRARNTGVNIATAPAWNAAADCEINDDLDEDGLIEDDWILPATLDMDDYLTAEQYYRHLLDNAASVKERTRCGSGCDGHHAHHELDHDTATLSDFDRTLLKRSVAAAVTDHQKHHGAGSVPQGLARWAHQTLRPRINWRQALATALRQSLHHKTGSADYTWQRPSRRQQPHDPVLRPAMTRPVPSIAVVVDTSGSMSQHELDQALTEISAIIASVVPGDSVRVLSVDTGVHTDQHIHHTNQITLKGAGGTDMATGITTAANTKPDAIVVITDGWTPWPHTRPPGARTVIAALTDNCCIDRVPQWIQTIDMSEHPHA